MTQLDRLEALAEKATPRPWKAADLLDPAVTMWTGASRGAIEDAEFIATLVNLHPDLIRVARATWLIGWNDDDGKCWCAEPTVVTGLPHDATCSVLRVALAPLYREVEG